MNYIDVRYANNKISDYDGLLAAHLTQHYIAIKKRPDNLKLVEMGVGTGKLCNLFKNIHKMDVLGIDMERSARLPAEINFLKASLNDIINGKFQIPKSDVFFTKSVIEHIQNPGDFFEGASKLIHNDGLVVVMCPNWQTQYSNFYDDPTHLRPFNLIGLSTAAAMSGFRVLKCEEFYQIPFFWRHPWLSTFFKITRLRLPTYLRNKHPLLRFSYENMLILVAEKNKND